MDLGAAIDKRILLQVKNLETSFDTHAGLVRAVRDVSFDVREGEIVGIVGESGSGKSVTALSIMRLLQFPGKITGGKITFNGQELTTLPRGEMRRLRGRHIAMIFQDPMTSLNPLFSIGHQIVETIRQHEKGSSAEAKEKAIAMLHQVGIPEPRQRFRHYPHEFSGGMRQRAMIAMALSCRPELLIADEPTTALDVTIQAQILKMLRELNDRLNMSTLLITHDLACIASTCTRVIVMYGGEIMEKGSDEDIFYRPRHPYTMGLLKSVPNVSSTALKERLIPIPGSPPDMLDPPKGCPFSPRCPYALKLCSVVPPPYSSEREGHDVKCWLCHDRAPTFAAYEAEKGGIRRERTLPA